MYKQLLIRLLPMLLFVSTLQAESSLLVDRECKRIAGKLASVSYRECLDRRLTYSNGNSVKQAPILFRDYAAGPEKQQGRVLLIGGIHGDEYASVTIVFKWLALLDQYNAGLFHWRIVPLLNPDGLLQEKSQRLNANGRDLDRSFPVAPGETLPADVPEAQWLAGVIQSFRPDVIVAIHAPHEVVDYASLESGTYALQRLEVSPVVPANGSLSQYAANAGIPVLTVELPYADIMPATDEVVTMWQDILNWVRTQTAVE